MPSSCVIGLLWGDEGKGKIIDLLSEEAEYVVRYGGGHNAGHTLIHDGERLVLHLIPCGIRRPGVVNVVANGVVVDPFHLVGEIRSLREHGFTVDLGKNLWVSERCHLVLPLHQAMDHAAETLRGKHAIGTTGRGIGPTYADRAARLGLRMGDLLRPDLLRQQLERLLTYHNPFLAAVDQPQVELEPLLNQLLALGQELSAAIVDTGHLLRQAEAAGKKILLEGAQGLLLDVDHGTYPYVTSSNASTGGVASGTGMAPAGLQRTHGVLKAYATRVGEGPFPTELHGDLADRLRTAGKEFGSTTGRPRRIGWFDAVAARYGVQVSGINDLVITNLDVLQGFKTLGMAIAYELADGQRSDCFPAFEVEQIKPIYQEFPGFDEDITKVRQYQALPAAARTYIEAIEAQLGVPVTLISVGPGREQVIRR